MSIRAKGTVTQGSIDRAPASLIPAEDLGRIFMAIPVPCLVLDPDCKIVAANDAYLRNTAAHPSDILGRPIFDILSATAEDPAAVTSLLRQSLERACANCVPDAMPTQHHFFRRPAAAGGGVVECHWRAINAPIPGEDDRPGYIVHCLEDAGDRDALEARIAALERELFQRTGEHDANAMPLSSDEQKLRLSQRVGRTGTFEWDIPADTVHWSAEIAALYGFPAKAFEGPYAGWRESIHPEDRATLEQRVQEALQTGSVEAEWRVLWPDGSEHWLAGRAVIHHDDAHRPLRMLGVNIDITDRKLIEDMLRREARHDPLTGLPNRALLYETACHLLPAMRRGHHLAAFLFIDLDRFKPINDTYGHDVGDAVLRDVARRLTEGLRGEDIVGRLGGDEFVAVVAHIHDREDVSGIAGNLLDRLASPYSVNGVEVQVSPSIGISIFPQDGEDVDELIRHADVAMYAAKQRGRSNFQFFHGGPGTARDASSCA
ncbi:diguanylate cyclase [Aromatoleum evansii]|uniref:Diguanylate cyclase n=1 Tax=Aromatoleum evansii TaxID=59406 RepID=A0ABZ1ASD7_AROEV|nr:Cyclic di-GMP phosphodiesterase Gmr [Azoarcus sp. Aa7]WRL48809.1 diguanylate cyclase [Aromatoleum evansii]